MSDTNLSSDQVEVIKCPHCGAVVKYPHGATSVLCDYCGQPVPLPDAPPPITVAAIPQVSAGNRRGWAVGIGCIGAFILFMILITVVLPLALAPKFVSIPTFAPVQAAVATSRPTPIPSPTPSFASIVLSFGGQGVGTGKFNNATSIGVDSADRIYVGERKGGRVQVFDPSGKFVTQWFAGNSKTILYGLAVDHNGIVYVAFDGGIARFEGATGKLLGTFEYVGGSGFESIAMAPDGGLVALHYRQDTDNLNAREGVHDDLVRFDRSGSVTHVISSVVSDQTDGPERELRLAVDGQNNLYVLSRYSDAVFKFSPQGKFVSRFGSRGNHSDQFGVVYAIATDSQGRVYVSDSNAIKVFDPSGRFRNSFTANGSVYSMAFDDQDTLFVTDGNRVSKFVLRER